MEKRTNDDGERSRRRKWTKNTDWFYDPGPLRNQEWHPMIEESRREGSRFSLAKVANPDTHLIFSLTL